MGQFVILIVVALVAAALAWGVTALLMGRDPGLEPVEPDGRAVPLPTARPLTEADLGEVRFDVTARGYRMAQVDQALRRVAYDIGYKEELIGVLEAEIAALRTGRLSDADALRQAREAAQRPGAASAESSEALSDAEVASDAEDTPEPAAAAAEATDTPEPATEENEAPADEWVASGARSTGTTESQPGGGAQ